jgi:hypothetical protein
MERFLKKRKAPEDEDVGSSRERDDAPSHEPDHALDEEPEDAPIR